MNCQLSRSRVALESPPAENIEKSRDELLLQLLKTPPQPRAKRERKPNPKSKKKTRPSSWGVILR